MTSLVDDRRLLVFVRFPEKGRVKTRLAQAIGDEAALALYTCFVSDALTLAGQIGCPTTVCFHPPEARSRVAEWLGHEVSYMPQKGDTLGERMYVAFCEALTSARRAVLIGSDIPGLPPEVLREAFTGLEAHDTVIGPAKDGGYYLLGFTSAAICAAPFGGIEWGTSTVFQSTIDILRERGLSIHVLPPWNDLDEYGDLEPFYISRKDSPPGTLSTVDFLRGYFD